MQQVHNLLCTRVAGSFMNLTMTIALYAAICKEQGLPFR